MFINSCSAVENLNSSLISSLREVKSELPSALGLLFHNITYFWGVISLFDSSSSDVIVCIITSTIDLTIRDFASGIGFYDKWL